MEIQVIERQKGKYRLLINGIECVFMPLDLFTDGIFPIKRCLNNNSFGWYVNRKFVSYKQIKKAIVTCTVEIIIASDVGEIEARLSNAQNVNVGILNAAIWKTDAKN